MAQAGLLETEHEAVQVGPAQPMRHHAAQHAALAGGIGERGLRFRRSALAGHKQNQPGAATLRAVQEIEQGCMRLVLRQAMQVKHGLDRLPPAFQPAAQAALQRGKRRRSRLLTAGFACLERGGLRGWNLVLGIGGRGMRWSRLRRHGAARQGPHRLRDMPPERPVLGSKVAAAAHGVSPATGQSTTRRAGWRMRPAAIPAASPAPTKRSPRKGPTMADPVSCAMTRRRAGWARRLSTPPATSPRSATIQKGRP